MILADRLSLAAAPVFAIMALLTAFGPADSAAMLCAAPHDNWAFDTMAPMYLLMGLFHAPPWMRLFSARNARRNNDRV